MSYTEKSKVIEINGRQFVDDFNKYRIMLKLEFAQEYVFFQKQILWDLSKKYRVNYYLIENPKRMIIY
jgi:hypothetical protein